MQARPITIYKKKQKYIVTIKEDKSITAKKTKEDNLGNFYSAWYIEEDNSFIAIKYSIDDLSNFDVFEYNLNSFKMKMYPKLTNKLPMKIFKNDSNILLSDRECVLVQFDAKTYKISQKLEEIKDMYSKRIVNISEITNEKVVFDPLIPDNYIVMGKDRFSYVNVVSCNKSSVLKKNGTVSNGSEVQLPQNVLGMTRNYDILKLMPMASFKKTGIIINSEFTNDGELVMITQQWLSILQALPTPFQFYNKIKK